MPSSSQERMPEPNNVRAWLEPKHIVILDKFEMELRLERLSAPVSSTSSNIDTPNTDRRMRVTVRTVEFLKAMIGATRWKTPAQLHGLLRSLGRELHAVGGYKEPTIGNCVRRIMAAVREEAMANKKGAGGAASTMQSILWAAPQHQQTPTMTRHQRHDSFSETKSDLPMDNYDLPPIFHQERPDFKQTIMEAIQEISLDLEDTYKNINDQALDHIHAGEVILVYGRSKTILLFLQAAAAKKRNFQVVVVVRNAEGRGMATSLAQSGIDTIVVSDSATFALMARVNKVLLPAHAVLANGGLIAPSGCNIVALAAKEMAVPVVCMTGLYKLCPVYPHEGQDTLQDMLSPSSVVPYAERLPGVDYMNPVHDYIAPELVNLYVTNAGAFQPSYIYRLLAENYHSDDWESFE